MSKKKKLAGLLLGVVAIFASMVPGVAWADPGDFGLTMSPLNQSIILNAGETYTSSFGISNPGSNTDDFEYEVEVSPFFVDENYDIYYSDTEGLNQIVDWITVNTTKGVLSPNESKEIVFTINVPEDAPAGGQYAAIKVQSTGASDATPGEGTGVQIYQKIAMAHIIYAEVAGTTNVGGEIIADTSSFLLSGNITASATVKNTGNIHGVARYTMQVFPLFSGEEVFTNEETPTEKTVLPGRSFYFETEWPETPEFGIFNVIYTVEFEGVTHQVKKMVIKCPIWLLFIIIFAIIAIIIYFVTKSRTRKKSSRRAETE